MYRGVGQSHISRNLFRKIGFDNDRCNVVVLWIAVHKRPGCGVNALSDIRCGILVVGLNEVEHTLGPELVSVGCGRFRDSISEEQRDLSRIEMNCRRQQKLASGKQAEGRTGAVQRALYVARFEEHEAGNVTGAGI